MRRFILLAALVLPAAPALAASTTPTEFGALFCRASVGDNMAPIAALFTPDLAETVQHALALNDEMQAAHPDEKPPLGDGLPWRSWTDSASTCVVEGVKEEGAKAMVTIRYGFDDTPTPTIPIRWSSPTSAAESGGWPISSSSTVPVSATSSRPHSTNKSAVRPCGSPPQTHLGALISKKNSLHYARNACLA